MRKLIALLMVLALMLNCAAWAESDELYDLYFEDFIMQVPGDTIGTMAEAIENNVPFFMFYEDYDPDAVFNANLNCVWSEEITDIDAAEPTEIAQTLLQMVVLQYEAMGIGVDDPQLYDAEYDELNGKRALSVLYSAVLDYSALGVDAQVLLYTFQLIVPIENCGTYNFTLTTEDLEACERLLTILASVEWTV